MFDDVVDTLADICSGSCPLARWRCCPWPPGAAPSCGVWTETWSGRCWTWLVGIVRKIFHSIQVMTSITSIVYQDEPRFLARLNSALREVEEAPGVVTRLVDTLKGALAGDRGPGPTPPWVTGQPVAVEVWKS